MKRQMRTMNYFLRTIKLSCMLLVAFLLAGIPMGNANAASGLKLYNYNTKKNVTYSDAQVKVTYNGIKIGVSRTPGILMNGVALVSYKDIFDRSFINADCIYNKPKSTVTISKYDITIVMTLNSKKAYVNGKAVTMQAAPLKVKYISDDVTKILVPSRFIAETLGYDYTWNKATSTVAIKKNSINLAYNNKELEYTGTQGLVTVDGKSVTLGTMPSIITNNTAMLRAKKVFADSSIRATYKYNKADNTVTLTKNENSLVMTIGSTKAYLNGNLKILDVAPMIVTNRETNMSFVMVPGTFTAKSLGYDYVWNNYNRTSVITSKKQIDSSHVLEPELGGEDSNAGDVKTLLYQWKLGSMSIYQGKNQHLLNENTASTTGSIYSIARDYSNLSQNAETYMIVSSAPFGKITSDYANKVIKIKAFNTFSENSTIQTLGVSSNLINNITTTYNPSDISAELVLSAIPEDMSYDLTLSPDQLILYVTLYTNVVTDVSISTNSTEDSITITGISPLKATVTRQDMLLYIDFPYTMNGIGEQFANVIGTRNIQLFYTSNSTNKLSLVVGINKESEYFISKEGNQYTITFTPPGVAEPGKEVEGDNNSNNNAEVDISKYEIIIPKPEGVQDKQVTHEDYYENLKFSIKIAGDYTSVLKNSLIVSKSSVITGIKVSLNNENETEIMFTTSKLQGYEFVMDNNYIYVHIDKPRNIYKNIVVLDAGHGGGAPGAIYQKTQEKTINFKILYEIGKKYFNSPLSEFKVYYTRTSDVDMTLSDRAAFASKVGADLFVSLHMNANTNTSPYGTEVYYSNNNNKTNAAGLNSKTLATLFVNQLSNTLGTNNRGTFSQQYTVVHKNTVPAVLIELGFMSNKSDFALITDKTFQENAVKAIYDTICLTFEMYPTGR